MAVSLHLSVRGLAPLSLRPPHSRVAAPPLRRRARAPPSRALFNDAFDASNVASATLHSSINVIASLADASSAIPVDAAAEIPEKQGGFLVGPLADVLEGMLKLIDGGLDAVGVPYSYGFSIIALTMIVKLATLPLTRKQVESTLAVQKIQPLVKDLQAKYADDQERLQIETARLYREAGVNPLAGCLPTLATLPIWIGLYRALTNAANEGILTDGFFWIPSLGGPVSMAARNDGSGMSWLFPFENGAPPIGWHDAGAYLVLPVLLTVSQFATQKLMSPQTQSDDPAQQQSQAILKFLPLMIGYFSLNVPSGLTLYWFINNLLSTAQQAYLKSAAPDSESVRAVEGALNTYDINAAPSGALGDNGPQVIDAPVTRVDDSGAPKRTGGPPKPNRGSKFRARKEAEAAANGASSSAGGEESQENGAAVPVEVVEAESVAVAASAGAAASSASDGDDSSEDQSSSRRKGRKGRRRR
ncbi:YidC/Oxa1 family membrane protein insertase [Pseudoscourfieldia marina]